MTIHENKGKIYQFGYSTCTNEERTLYSAEKYDFYFYIKPILFKGYDNDIVFINNNKNI